MILLAQEVPLIPFDPNVALDNLIPIFGIAGGTIVVIFVIFAILRWMKYHHELAREKLKVDRAPVPSVEPDKVKRLQERLENLENLLCRLDAEMNQQLEKSLGSGRRISMENPQPGNSQTPTTLMHLISALENRYQVLQELGRGGMGIVYQAYDKQLKEQVALKIISPLFGNDPDAVERLKREVSSARRIAHPNVIRIFDIGESSGLHFVSMEYFAGTSLRDYIKRNGAVSLIQAKNIVLQICDGLQAAHGQGVIHRDLKSHNIIINPANHIKIIDFGLARSTYAEGMTATGLILGTPEYMAPEQISGKKVDERADIYSLGIILYEIFTGRVPFTGDSPIAVGFQQLKDPPQDPRQINPQLTDDVTAIILKALEKDPFRRFRSVQEMREAIEQILGSTAAQFSPPVSSKGPISTLQKD